MREITLIKYVETRHKAYVEAFCKQTGQELVAILPRDAISEEVHYAFSNYANEGAYSIRGIFQTLEGY